MFRKLVLSAVLTTSALTGLATSADARPPADFHRARFEVLVECGRRWEPRGCFGNRFEAEQVAHRLRHEGFRVEIRECW